MQFEQLPIAGAALVHLDRHTDHRGFFSRAWCEQEFADHGLPAHVAQINYSHNDRKATLRGMHYQLAPHEEAKVIRCIRGEIYDVLVDLRPGSPTRGRWYGATLSAANADMLVVPEGCAHGFITLADDTDVLYLVSVPYAPGAERGLRWDDPAFNIAWPIRPLVFSEKDADWPDYVPADSGLEVAR